jgi:hypothetical protein
MRAQAAVAGPRLELRPVHAVAREHMQKRHAVVEAIGMEAHGHPERRIDRIADRLRVDVGDRARVCGDIALAQKNV